jgi:threonine/homoserine/homoserine lactone efflux protein
MLTYLVEVAVLEPTSFYLFLATAVVLVVTPGPDTVLILSRTLASGARAGLMTLLGTQVGNMIHALLAGVGVSTVVLVFPYAFTAMKFLGVGYLIYLAVQAWRAPATLDLQPGAHGRDGNAAAYFVQGLLNNLANPKMIAFFLALFPQFIHPEHGSLALQSLVLGTTLAAMAVGWIGLVVLLVARARAAVASSPGFLKAANRLASLSFLGLAVRLAVQENR